MGIEDEINKLDIDLTQFRGKPLTASAFESVLMDWNSLSGSSNEDISRVKEVFTNLLVNCPDAPAFSGFVQMPNVIILMMCSFKIGRRYEQVKTK